MNRKLIAEELMKIAENLIAAQNYYLVVFWRGNPQLPNGGYHRGEVVKASTAANAFKNVDKKHSKSAYGSCFALAAYELIGYVDIESLSKYKTIKDIEKMLENKGYLKEDGESFSY